MGSYLSKSSTLILAARCSLNPVSSNTSSTMVFMSTLSGVLWTHTLNHQAEII